MAKKVETEGLEPEDLPATTSRFGGLAEVFSSTFQRKREVKRFYRSGSEPRGSSWTETGSQIVQSARRQGDYPAAYHHSSENTSPDNHNVGNVTGMSGMPAEGSRSSADETVRNSQSGYVPARVNVVPAPPSLITDPLPSAELVLGEVLDSEAELMEIDLAARPPGIAENDEQQQATDQDAGVIDGQITDAQVPSGSKTRKAIKKNK